MTDNARAAAALGGIEMQIIRQLKVPTGDILVVQGEKGQLEMLSLGDYGKDLNLKADFLGLTRDIKQVIHRNLLPLTEKWVVTISTQYGCSMGCLFCDVPKVGPGRNATLKDLIHQVLLAVTQIHPEIEWTNRLNVHFARMGEPTWNPNVLDAAKWMKEHLDPEYKVHPVVSTMMPRKNIWLKTFIHTWMRIKNRQYRGNAGLQLSINSTDEHERQFMFNNNACSLEEIARIMEGIIPNGRKITLNFAVADYAIDPTILLKYFDPDYYLIKLTPMHKTRIALINDIMTRGDYTTLLPYKDHEEALKTSGYDVLVFIASEYEDLGRITCGNAILSGSLPECPYQELTLEGGANAPILHRTGGPNRTHVHPG
jgi:23S rRNA (adenine2503-C2)-methyltransferase